MPEQQATNHQLTLKTGLFADDQTLSHALEHRADSTKGMIIDLTSSTLNDAQWDDILSRILSATKVITV